MNKILTAEPTAEEAKAIEAEMDSIFDQIRHIDQRILKDQQEIDRLSIKTRKTLDELKAR